MDPAIDTIRRALSGEPGACSFLDRTSSIYVLDATDATNPKTYGCWNFIHQAMNEIERYEAGFVSSNRSHKLQNGASLASHVKLLATVAMRVARRAPDVDRKLVKTCIANASQYQASPNQSQWLVDLNLELREIVIGRIAAMAFDFSFHRRTGAHGLSAFANPAVMEMFCAVLAANAVSSGPSAINHFINEWIVPSAKTLPPYAVTCVILHLALEALRKSAPAGTQDMLQQLSSSVMSTVLAPVLLDAVSESSASNSDETGDHERNNQIVAVSLRAMERWCTATELSLPQIKHICSKVEINIVDIISDALYSDCKDAIDALAELIDTATRCDAAPYVLEERMTQLRYLMQVDEASFKSNFTTDQLISIESKEMASITDELVSAVGLQRFRFVERQNNGDHDVCRSLARIAVAVCTDSLKNACNNQPLKTESGLVDLIMKAASHPSVNIAGISLKALTLLVKWEMGLALPLLPLLQRRAITPHHVIVGAPSLAASDLCGVNFHEFQNFRETVLVDALMACYQAARDNYMDSCTSAVEEFCSASATIDVSLHLEAALFCLGAVADEAFLLQEPFPHSAQLERCTKALVGKPASMMNNPLTLAQMCQFLKRYKRWYVEGKTNGALDVATELAMSTFTLSTSAFPNNRITLDIIRETSISPYSEAVSTLREFLCSAPENYVSISAIAALGAGWEASYAACNRSNTVTIDDRKSLCIGICHVLAALPVNQRIRSFHALALPSLDCFQMMVKLANDSIAENHSQEKIDLTLSRVADEILILTTMSRTFTNACSVNDVSMESGCKTSAERQDPIPEAILKIIQKIWPTLTHVASSYSGDKNVANAISTFLVDFLPPDCQDAASFALSKELCSLAWLMMKSTKIGTIQFQPILNFLVALIDMYGEVLENNVNSSVPCGQTITDHRQEFSSQIKTLLLSTIESIRSRVGTISKEQGQGQPAFESKCEHPKETSNERLKITYAGIFFLFKMCVERCPQFFFQLPTYSDVHLDDKLLHERAVEFAVAASIDADVEISKAAMKFLESMVKLADSNNEEVRRIMSETMARIQSNLVSMILIGVCGQMEYSTLKDASRLLHTLLRYLVASLTVQNRPNFVNVLNHEHFRLGDNAKRTVMQLLYRCSRNELTSDELTIVLEEIWELHRLDDIHFLDSSNVVARFATKYSTYCVKST